METGNSSSGYARCHHMVNYFSLCGKCWSTYIHKRPNIGNALRGLFTRTQSEKDGSNKAHALSHMSLGVISTKHGVRRTNLTII